MCSDPRWRWLVPALCMLTACDASADTSAPTSGTTLEASPGHCVALHKGQECRHVQLLRWRVPDDEHYCLFDNRVADPIVCWERRALTQVDYAYASSASVTFELRHSGSAEVRASTRVSTSWVYRTSRRSVSGWRLF